MLLRMVFTSQMPNYPKVSIATWLDKFKKHAKETQKIHSQNRNGNYCFGCLWNFDLIFFLFLFQRVKCINYDCENIIYLLLLLALQGVYTTWTSKVKGLISLVFKERIINSSNIFFHSATRWVSIGWTLCYNSEESLN